MQTHAGKFLEIPFQIERFWQSRWPGPFAEHPWPAFAAYLSFHQPLQKGVRGQVNGERKNAQYLSLKLTIFIAKNHGKDAL